MEQTSAALNDNAATNISNNNIVSDDNPSESEESVESIDISEDCILPSYMVLILWSLYGTVTTRLYIYVCSKKA